MVNDLADLYVGNKEWSLNQGTYISNNINWKQTMFFVLNDKHVCMVQKLVSKLVNKLGVKHKEQGNAAVMLQTYLGI